MDQESRHDNKFSLDSLFKYRGIWEIGRVGALLFTDTNTDWNICFMIWNLQVMSYRKLTIIFLELHYTRLVVVNWIASVYELKNIYH